MSIIVHGGAWSVPDSLVAASVAGVERAATAGHAVLKAGGSAMDAVEAAVRVLEDDPAFDAGTGSVLTSSGTVEMDAAVMDGAKLGAGGVAAVAGIRNPISLARRVMTETSHVLLVGAGADAFAAEQGFARVPTDELITEDARKAYERQLTYADGVEADFAGHDTVGCAAVDLQGNVAAGTSTGGITFKRPGRVGDSPILGAGLYADNALGAISATGHGESLAKVVLSRDALWRHELLSGSGSSPLLDEAMRASLAMMDKRLGSHGGCVGVLPDGRVAHAFTTRRMPHASIVGVDGTLTSGIEP